MPLASPNQQSATSPEPTCTDALCLRNYEGAHSVTIDVILSEDGQPVHELTVTLDPLTIESLDLPVAPGEYHLTATTDDAHATASCTLGDEPTALAFIEVGNGVVSVVDEAY